MLYPILDIGQLAFIYAEDIEIARYVIKEFELYEQMGGTYIQDADSSNVMPAYQINLINFGDKSIEFLFNRN